MNNRFTIASNGIAACCILSADTIYAGSAAQILAEYLQKITGAVIPLEDNGANRILVGEPYPGESEEVFWSVDSDNTMRITGEGPRGPVYAVCHFLESLGCGFWAPDNETVPVNPNLSLEVGSTYRSAPAFLYRQPLGETAMDTEWCVKMGINGDIWAPRLPEELGGHFYIDLRQSMAGMNAKDYFDTHPEWFAWREKEGKHSPRQLCTHNEEAMAEVIRLAKKLLAEEPERTFISVSLGDNADFCECEKCRALTAREGASSALVVHAANTVARAIREEYPHVQVIFLAYWVTERPPLHMKLEDTVAVCWAMLDRDHKFAPASNPRHDLFLDKWRTLADNRVYIWGYHAQFHAYMLPTPTLDWMGHEMRQYQKQEIKGVFTQMPYGSLSDFSDLRTWLFAKLAWNPAQDEKQLIRQWLEGACGAGAPYMEAWLERMKIAKNRQKGFFLSLYQTDNRAWLTPEDVFAGKELFEKAMAATAEDPRVNAQIRQQYPCILLTLLLRYYRDLAEAAEKRGTPLPSREALLEELAALQKEFQCNCFAEYGDGFLEGLRNDTILTPMQKKTDHPAVVHISPDQLTGTYVTHEADPDGVPYISMRVDSAALGFPFMDTNNGCITWYMPAELEGRWHVLVKIRSGATEVQQTTGYITLHTKPFGGEVARACLRSSPGEEGWETVDLGEYELPEGSLLRIFPGVMADCRFVDVQDLVLLQPGVL